MIVDEGRLEGIPHKADDVLLAEIKSLMAGNQILTQISTEVCWIIRVDRHVHTSPEEGLEVMILQLVEDPESDI